MKLFGNCIEPRVEEVFDTLGSFDFSSSDELNKWAKNMYISQRHRLLQDICACMYLSENKSSILDVGSAPFFTAASLALLDRNVIATDIEPSRFSIFLRKLDINVIECDIENEKLPLKENSVDLVLLSEVFEHLRIDLIFTMSEIRRVLRPGGYLILSTPNFFEIGKMLRLLIKGKTSNIFEEYMKLKSVGHMGHVREYTSRDVEDFLGKMMLTVEKRIYRGINNWSLRPTSLLKRGALPVC